jgi:hypothetical protein
LTREDFPWIAKFISLNFSKILVQLREAPRMFLVFQQLVFAAVSRFSTGKAAVDF